MSDRAHTGFSTRAIRAASKTPAVDQRPTSVPIYQTATFTSVDAEELADVVSDGRVGYSYSRLSNPTSRALGDAFADISRAEAGTTLASGMGAVHAALGANLKAGDRVVGPLAAYGSSRKLLADIFQRFGVRVDLVDMTDNAVVDTAIAEAPTTVVYAETIANPTTVVTDHATVARLAHEHGATYIVDNTFATPYVCRPLELGADLVLESATKFLGGHSDVIAGVVAGRADLIRRVEAFQNDTGGTIGPFDAFLVLRGLLSLGVRMERHVRNAAALAGWLERQDGVVRVMYPGLPTHPQHDVAMRQFRDGAAGGMLAFEVEGGREGGQAIIDAMRLPELTASLGSVHTFVVHPPSTSQRQLSDEELVVSGITPGLLRVSVGLEDLEDLQADFAAALEVARRAGRPATVGV
ncbi:MAG: trans-sulfuration enzyme family protein [Chloroflexota bacterium]